MLFDMSGGHHHFKNTSPFITSSSKQNSLSGGAANSSTIVVSHPPNILEKAKRHYNSEVDPARYRKVIEEGITKFACSICGNTYKWRKSLNKHWKEKHITETPPPLDAPVTVKLRNGTTTVNCIATNGTTLTIPSSQNNNNTNNHQPIQMKKSDHSFSMNNNSFDKKPVLKPNDINQKMVNSTSTPINKNSLQMNSNNLNRSLNNSNLKQSSHSTPIISSSNNNNNINNNNNNNLPTVVPPSNNVFAYLNALQQYMNNAALASNISFNTPTNESKMNSKNHTNSNGSNDLKRHKKQEDSIERPLDLSMKTNIITNQRRRSSSCDSGNNDGSIYNRQSASINLKNLENSIKRLKTLNNNDKQSFNKHESRKSISEKQQSSSSSSSRNSSPNSSLSNSSSINNNNNHTPNDKNGSKRLIKEESHGNSFNNSKHNNSSNNLSSASASVTAYNQKLFVCSICDSKFHVVDHINEHFLKNHYNEYQRELSSKSPPRNTNVAQQNEEWNLSDPTNPLKCIKCDFVGRWPTELQKHAASHSTSRPFKCLICSLTYKWRWDLAKHFDRTHPTFRNPYKKRDRDAARSSLVNPNDSGTDNKNNKSQQNFSNKKSNNQRSRSRSADSNFDDSNRSQSPSSDIGSESSFKNNNNNNNLIDYSINKPNKTKLQNNLIKPTLPKLSKNMHETTGLNQLPFDQYNPAIMTSLLANNNNNNNNNSSNNNNNALWAACLASLTNQPMMPPPPSQSLLLFQQYQKMSSGLPPSQEALLNAINMDPSAASLMLHTLMSQQGLNSSNQKNVNILSPLSNTSSSSQLNNHNNTFLINKLNNSIQSSCSTSSVASQQQSLNNKKQKTNNNDNTSINNINSMEKESRNFSCYWCDFKGRWRSEIIQHMRCHHAREKPYRCSACMYASNWKWDVQKHTKKQHPNNINAKIVEIPDQILFPDIKDFNFFESATPAPPQTTTIKPTSQSTSPSSSSTTSSYSSSTSHTKSIPNLTPPSSNQSTASSTSSSNKIKQNINTTPKLNIKSSLCCQQCPYVACNLSDLRRHLIVHSNEQPYHCCSCDFKSKWKSDVKKHQRSMGHIGPILVGKKAMQKVIENLGLDRTSMVNLYGPNIQVIDNKQCKSNEKLIDEDNLQYKNNTNLRVNKKRKRCDDSMDNINNNNINNNDYEDQEEFIEDEEEEDDEFEQLNEEDDDEVEIDEDDESYQNNNNNNHEDDEMINHENNQDDENNNMIDDEEEEDCNNLEIENDDEEL